MDEVDILDEIEFLLTRPSRDVTADLMADTPPILVSTHTSLAGRDGNHLRR